MSNPINHLLDQIETINQNQNSFIHNYRNSFKVEKYIEQTNAITEKWQREQNDSNSNLKFLTKLFILLPTDYYYGKEEVVNNLICLLKSLKEEKWTQKAAFFILNKILESSSFWNVDKYRSEYRPLVWKFYQAMKEAGLITSATLVENKEMAFHLLHLCLDEEKQDNDLADELISLNPDLDLINQSDKKSKKTLLQTFAEKDPIGNFGIHYLLDKGANPNKFEEGTTPFLISCAIRERNAEEILHRLKLDPHVDPTVMDENGKTAYAHLASSFQNSDFLESFKLDTEYLPKIIADYLDPLYCRTIDHKEEIEDLKDHIKLFIDAWEKSKEIKNPTALNQATLFFLENLGFCFHESKMQDMHPLIQLLQMMKREKNFGIIALDLTERIIKYQAVDAAREILSSLKDDLKGKFLSKSVLSEIVFNALKIGKKGDQIADLILEIHPSILNETLDSGRWEEPKSLLQKALDEGNIYAIDYLLKLGAKSSENEFLLISAVRKENIEIVRLLLEFDFDVNETDAIGATPLLEACRKGNLEMVDLLLQNKDLKPPFPTTRGTIPFQEAQKQNRYDIAEKLMQRYGPEQLKELFTPYQKFLNFFFGVTPEVFQELVLHEIKRTQESKSGYVFDRNMLTYFSKKYEEFWNKNSHEITSLHSSLLNIPFSEAYINFVSKQLKVYREMQKDPRMQSFPIQELWRFAIDAEMEKFGCCIFEDEPGYLKSFFQGMLFALQTAENPKTPSWYIQLHQNIIANTYKRNIFETEWNPGSMAYVSISPDLRKGSGCGFSISHLDQDPLGVEDLRRRKGSSTYRFEESSQTIAYAMTGNEKETTERLERLFLRFNELLPKTSSRAEKLVLFLWAARELEIEHLFEDANGRASHLALLSMVAGEKDLPFFLFPDPNVFDGNSPESLAFRYLEACVNFQHGGKGHHFKTSQETKKLDSIELVDENLIALRNELKALVCGKNWEEVIQAIERN